MGVERQLSASQALRKLRESQGHSLRTAASELGLAASFLSRIERGERSYSPELGRRMADYYGVSSEFIDLADGKLPDDVIRILQDHPEEITRLRETYGEVPPNDRRAGTGLDRTALGQSTRPVQAHRAHSIGGIQHGI